MQYEQRDTTNFAVNCMGKIFGVNLGENYHLKTRFASAIETIWLIAGFYSVFSEPRFHDDSAAHKIHHDGQHY